MAKSSQRLDDLRVAPVRFLSNSNDHIAEAFLDPRSPILSRLRLWSLGVGVFHRSNPFTKRGISDDRNQVLDSST